MKKQVNRPRPVLLMILDGFGLRDEIEGNAIRAAHTPNLDRLFADYPSTQLGASGEAVGLPAGQMGNSEVGHLNLGAGRIVYQDFTRISKAIEEGKFFRNEVLLAALDNVKKKDSSLHLMGLLSDGGVHSHITHLCALLELAKQQGVRPYVHAFLDGRDVPPKSALDYIKEAENKMGILGGRIATVSGRYYAMDRDKRWRRVEKAYHALTLGIGVQACSAREAVEAAYNRGETDEFVLPTVITEEGKPVSRIQENDSVIFYNFRSDRARQITHAFTDEVFLDFDRVVHPEVFFVCMTQYDEKIKAPVAFPAEYLKNTLGEVLGKNGLRQLRLAETEKYAHVTFFFNGGKEEPNVGEDRILIPSPKVATYDLKPEMSAYGITDVVGEKMGMYDVIILNYANLDMVGHTGVFQAAVKAVEAIDVCVGRVIEGVRKAGGILILIGDHGNAEEMIGEDGKPHTAHTSNPVPLVLVSREKAELRKGILADVAPTVLDLLCIEKPEEMTGTSLLVH